MRTSIYSVHPGIAMVQRAIADLPARTGRSLEEWIALIKKQGPRDKNTRTPARLINTGGLKKGDRITHRIEVTSLADIDEDLMRWLERAHDMDR